MPLGEFEDIVIICATEPVNRLGVVADRGKVAGPGRRDRLDELDLDGVGVLHLVYQDMAKHSSL